MMKALAIVVIAYIVIALIACFFNGQQVTNPNSNFAPPEPPPLKPHTPTSTPTATIEEGKVKVDEIRGALNEASNDKFETNDKLVSEGFNYIVDNDGTHCYANNTSHTIYGGPANQGGVDGNNPTAVIQACIDSLTSGGKVFIRNVPDAPYSINKDLVCDSNIQFVSDGAQLVLSGASVLTKAMFDLNGKDNLVFDGLYLNGNTATAGRGIGGSFGNNVTIRNCKFDAWNTRHAIGAYSGNGLFLLNNFIGDCTGAGSEGGCENVLVRGNYVFESCSDYPIMIAGNTAMNNIVTIANNSVSYGTSGAGGCIDVVASNAIISNNLCYGATTAGIYVHDNFDTGGTDSISNITISGNNVKSCKQKGIIVANNDANRVDLLIENNYVEDGLTLNTINDALIVGNIFSSGYVYTVKCSHINFFRNEITGDDYCFNIENGAICLDKVVIIGNRLSANKSIFAGGRLPTNLRCKGLVVHLIFYKSQ
jgi:hypothetical protein